MAVSVAFGWKTSSDTAGESASPDSAPGDPALHPAALYIEPWVRIPLEEGLDTTVSADQALHPGITLEPTPTPVPTPVPTRAVSAAAVPQSSAAGVEQWRELVASIFPAESVETVLRIMNCESHGNPNATGSSGERGLMQVIPRFHQAKADVLFGLGADLYDPRVNLSVAAVISGNGASFAAWSCR